MDKLKNIIKAVLLLSALFLLLSIHFSAGDDETEAPFNLIDAAKSLYSASNADSGSGISSKPPNLDFRGGGGGEEAGVKVKDAVVKSVDETKAAMKDSAKSAAEVVDKTVNKLKTSLSEHDHEL